MMSENAKQQVRTDVGADDVELDQAIDELRGVLKKGGGTPDAGSAGKKADQAAGGTGKESELDDMDAASGSAFPGFQDFMPENGAPSVGAAPDARHSESRLDLIMDIPIDVEIVLGTSRMQVSQLMKLTEGATIALDRRIGEPVEITVNGHVIGHGEITVLEDDETRFGIRLLDVAAGSN
ncbi:MAG TPA: flagellar motor switch protein FliN [Pararhizobium sp.]|nr:flagellar motor switch protein FliN [Pararhizobium sp.]